MSWKFTLAILLDSSEWSALRKNVVGIWQVPLRHWASKVFHRAFLVSICPLEMKGPRHSKAIKLSVGQFVLQGPLLTHSAKPPAFSFWVLSPAFEKSEVPRVFREQSNLEWEASCLHILGDTVVNTLTVFCPLKNAVNVLSREIRCLMMWGCGSLFICFCVHCGFLFHMHVNQRKMNLWSTKIS